MDEPTVRCLAERGAGSMERPAPYLMQGACVEASHLTSQ